MEVNKAKYKEFIKALEQDISNLATERFGSIEAFAAATGNHKDIARYLETTLAKDFFGTMMSLDYKVTITSKGGKTFELPIIIR